MHAENSLCGNDYLDHAGCRGAVLSSLAALALSACGFGEGSLPGARQKGLVDSPYNWLMFHGDRAHSGWNSNETILTPANVASASFGKLWESPELDYDDSGHRAHMYASPLYVDQVTMTTGDIYDGMVLSLIFAATNANWVYAISATENGVAHRGDIIWSYRLGPNFGTYDGISQGIYGTPIIDLGTTPPRLYVAGDTNLDPDGRKWRVFALDLGSGNVLTGWPLNLDNSTVGDAAPPGIQQNGPARFEDTGIMSQRGALNLSADRTILYVPFGGYSDQAAGFMVTIDTGIVSGNVAIRSSFVGGRSSGTANGGMWGSGGPAIDSNGVVYMTTGNSPSGSGPAVGVWGESILAWGPNPALSLVGTYTPWNYCQMDYWDTDLSGTAPVVIDVDPTVTNTPHLLTLGGKGGNAYLLNRDNLRAASDRRPPCHWIPGDVNRALDPTAPPADSSLFGPDTYPWYRSEDGMNLPRRGPLNIFGPYVEGPTCCNYARARSTPAYFRDANGAVYVVFTGSTKRGVEDDTPISPSVVRTKLNTPGPTQSAYLTIAAQDASIIFKSPGSPVVSSNGADINSAIIWVLEPNVLRGDSLTNPDIHATLYAISAASMTPIQVIYQSASADMYSGAKYNHPIVSNGVVYTGTERIVAFGLLP